MPNLFPRYEDTSEVIKCLFKFLANNFIFEITRNTGKTKGNKFIVEMFKIASRIISICNKNNIYVYIITGKKKRANESYYKYKKLISDSNYCLNDYCLNDKCFMQLDYSFRERKFRLESEP